MRRNLFATGLELPHSEGREAGLVINEERPLVIRIGERDYPVPGVDVDQMEAFLYVLGKLHDALERELREAGGQIVRVITPLRSNDNLESWYWVAIFFE